jgi:hypothetical protein
LRRSFHLLFRRLYDRWLRLLRLVWMMICGSALNAETVAARVSKDGSSTTALPRIKDKISAFFILPPLMIDLFGSMW